MSSPLEPSRSLSRRPRTFEELARLSDAELDVATGAALIARDAYGRVDVDQLLTSLARLADGLPASAMAELEPAEQARRLAAHVRDTLGFRGNEDEYHDPRNSLLSDVLERRLGIPITLALVTTEIGTRAGVLARGVAFPGHFLVRVDDPAALAEGPRAAPAALIDPFAGEVLERPALVALLRRTLGEKAELAPFHLLPASPRGTLVRMLTNLKLVHLARRDLPRAHLALDRIVCLTPNATSALRERGGLADKLGATAAARADFERVLELEPEAKDASVLRAHITRLASTSRRALN